jgi:hypothetical protein
MLSTVRFRIPKAAADALHLSAVKRRARQASVTDVRFDVDERRSGSVEVKVTCSIAMAIFLVGELRTLGERAKAKHDTTLVAACSQAVSVAFKAIDDADKASIKASNRDTMPRA